MIAVLTAGVAGIGAYALAPGLGGGPYEDRIVIVHIGDGHAVEALVHHSVCEVGRRYMEVRETPTEVRLRVTGARPDPHARECPAVLARTRLRAQLSTGLGSRQVTDWQGRPLPTARP